MLGRWPIIFSIISASVSVPEILEIQNALNVEFMLDVNMQRKKLPLLTLLNTAILRPKIFTPYH